MEDCLLNPLPGVVVSQTTLTPAVMNTTVSENVTALTLTPVTLFTTSPGCLAFNLSTCEACAPGSYYHNGETQTVTFTVIDLITLL